MAKPIINTERDRQHAEVLLADPMITGFFAEAQEQLLQDFRMSKNPQEREELFAYLKAVERLKLHLQSYIQTGRLSEMKRGIA
jgi:hypothetical protein